MGKKKAYDSHRLLVNNRLLLKEDIKPDSVYYLISSIMSIHLNRVSPHNNVYQSRFKLPTREL